MKKVKVFFKNKQAIVGIVILTVLVLMAIFAPVISPGNPLFSVGTPIQAPNFEFIFGTDNVGRDVLAMIVWGSRVSMIFAFGAAGLSLIIGVVLGALSGYIGGVVDDILSRFLRYFTSSQEHFLSY